MKMLLICVLIATSLFAELKNKSANTLINTTGKSSSKDSLSSDTIDFTTQIKPILTNHSSPCHFEGGKMYGRLPFDKDTTIVGHEETMLRRLKDEKEDALIKQYIQQQKNNK